MPFPSASVALQDLAPRYRLADAEVALWLLPLDALTGPVVERLSASLSAAELARNRQYGRAPLRRRDAACRGLLRELLIRGEHGKPLLAGDDVGVHFNYSHSGDYVVFAFTRAGEVGVDIEVGSRRANALGIARKFFTGREYRALEALPDALRQAEFLRYWTLKEAWLKARGEGIFAGLDRFSIALPAADEGDARVLVHGDGGAVDAGEAIYCHSALAAPGYRLGLVVRGAPGHLSVSQCEVRP